MGQLSKSDAIALKDKFQGREKLLLRRGERASKRCVGDGDGKVVVEWSGKSSWGRWRKIGDVWIIGSSANGMGRGIFFWFASNQGWKVTIPKYDY